MNIYTYAHMELFNNYLQCVFRIFEMIAQNGLVMYKKG